MSQIGEVRKTRAVNGPVITGTDKEPVLNGPSTSTEVEAENRTGS